MILSLTTTHLNTVLNGLLPLLGPNNPVLCTHTRFILDYDLRTNMRHGNGGGVMNYSEDLFPGLLYRRQSQVLEESTEYSRKRNILDHDLRHHETRPDTATEVPWAIRKMHLCPHLPATKFLKNFGCFPNLCLYVCSKNKMSGGGPKVLFGNHVPVG
jgi:hypothetical protein